MSLPKPTSSEKVGRPWMGIDPRVLWELLNHIEKGWANKSILAFPAKKQEGMGIGQITNSTWKRDIVRVLNFSATSLLKDLLCAQDGYNVCERQQKKKKKQEFYQY